MKTYRVVQQGRLYKIEWNGGGEVSPKLKGLYTSHIEAQNAINMYENDKPYSRTKSVRKVDNGKSEDAA